MRSAVHAAVLSLVIEKPSYGSEIGRRFEERYRGLLAPIRHKVYEALAALEAEGLIEPIALSEAPAGKGMRATAKGAQTYRGWLREPVAFAVDAPLQVKIRFASTRAEDTETARFLLGEYERAVLRLARGGAAQPGNFIEEALDEERRVSVDAALRWIAWGRDQIRRRETGSTS